MNHDSARGPGEPHREGGHRLGARALDHGVEAVRLGLRQLVELPRVRHAELPGEFEGWLAHPRDVDVGALGKGELRREQADRARAEHEHRLPAQECGSADGAQAVARRLDEGRGGDAHVLRDLEREARRDDHLLREGTGPAVADADLGAVRADVVDTATAELAPTAAEHRVARHEATQPPVVIRGAHADSGTARPTRAPAAGGSG